MACTVQTLAELGYTGTSLAEIARRAEVSKGVISYYFANKDQLMEQVLMDVYRRAGEAIAQRTSREDDPRAVLRAYVQTNMEFLAENPADIRAVVQIASVARRADGTLRFAPQGQDPVLTHLEQLLLAGQTAGTFGAFDARALAVLIRGAIDTASGRMVTDPLFDIQRYTRELVRLVQLAITHSATGEETRDEIRSSDGD